MRKILMISYYFPPIMDVGSLRALGFAKHLPEHGWQPYVLSVQNPDTSLCRVGSEQPPQEIKTFYCRSWFYLNKISWKANGVLRIVLKIFGVNLKNNVVSDVLCLPDAFVGWTFPAFLKGRSIIGKHNIDVIYVSCKPFSSALTGVLLKNATNKPLILDFRDPASFPDSLFNNGTAGRFNRSVTKKIEKFVFESTDRLITTTDSVKEVYLKKYPFLIENVHRIYNGYFLPPQKNDKTIKQNKFTIGYAGNFYQALVSYEQFFKAMRIIVDEKLIGPEHFEFLYIGQLRGQNNWLRKAEEDFQLHGHISAIGPVPREEVPRILSQCALQLLRIVPPMISTKLFEALRDGIPMLAVIRSSEVEKLIKTYSPGSYVVSSGKVGDIVDAIIDSYKRWKNGKLVTTQNDEYLKNFSKKILTSEFVNILNTAVTTERVKNDNSINL